ELTARRGVFVLGVEGGAFPEGEVREKGYAVRPVGPRWEITLADGQSIDPVLQLVRDKGLRMTHMVEQRQTLEDIFVSMVEAAEPGVDDRRRRRAAARERDDRDRNDRRGSREDYR